jgi:hypothetical protein
MQRRRFDPPAALTLALPALLALGACKHESAGTAGDLGRTSESSLPVQPSPAGATGPSVDSVRADSAGGQLALPPAVGSKAMTLPSIGATVLVPAPASAPTASVPMAGFGAGTFPESTSVPHVDSIVRPLLRPDTVRPLFPPAAIPGMSGTRPFGFDTSTTPPAPFPHPAKPGTP